MSGWWRYIGIGLFGLITLLASSGAYADIRLSDEGRQKALALLPELVAAVPVDAHLRIAELETKLSQTAAPEERAEILKELIFHAIDIAEAAPLAKFIAEARTLGQKTRDRELLLYADLGKATWLSLEGQPLDAKKLILKTRENAQKQGDVIDVFFADAVMAIIGPDLGNFLEGLSTMAQGAQSLPDTPRGNRMRMLAYLTLAYTYTTVDEIDPIVDYYTKALALAEKEHIAFDRESALFNLASVLNDLEETGLAKKCYLSLQKIIGQTKRVQGRYYVLYGLAWIAYDQGDYKEAIRLSTDALDHFASDPAFDTSLFDLTAMSYARIGDTANARHYFEKSQAYYESHHDARIHTPDAEGLLTRAYIQKAEGKTEDAFKTLDAARRAQNKSQYERFKNSVTDLRTSLETMLAKQRAEQELKKARADYDRLIVIFSLLIALGAVLLLVMQRRHTRALRRSMQEAEIANQSKSEFLANMSHELRTPLNAILGFSEMMEQHVFGKLGARQYDEYVGHIHESGRHLLDIINDILDLSKVESGRLTLREEEIDIAPVFEDVKTLLAQRARERGVNLETEISRDMPLLKADRRLIKQILINLLNNSVKFTNSSGTVLMRARLDENGGIRRMLIDTGVGMTKKELEIALTPFGQAGTTTTRRHEGTGLGLPLVNSLVELHGGQLIIQSVKGQGTTGTAVFPAERTVVPRA